MCHIKLVVLKKMVEGLDSEGSSKSHDHIHLSENCEVDLISKLYISWWVALYPGASLMPCSHSYGVTVHRPGTC